MGAVIWSVDLFLVVLASTAHLIKVPKKRMSLLRADVDPLTHNKSTEASFDLRKTYMTTVIGVTTTTTFIDSKTKDEPRRWA